MKKAKVLARIAQNQTNVRFSEMAGLVQAFGFIEARVAGSHHIFKHPDIPELINLQEVAGQAKPYQVKRTFV